MGNENREQKGVMKFISAFSERGKGLIYPKRMHSRRMNLILF